VFTVIDYKTGRRARASFDSVATGRALQLALYALAVWRLDIAGLRALTWQMGYWYIRETGFASDVKGKRTRPGEPLPSIEEAAWLELVGTLEERIAKLAAGVRSGNFAVYNLDEQCTSGCPYNTICRVGQIRPLAGQLQKHPGANAPGSPGSLT
jgi:hypothetical protein